jgi:hypothetical protein
VPVINESDSTTEASSCREVPFLGDAWLETGKAKVSIGIGQLNTPGFSARGLTFRLTIEGVGFDWGDRMSGHSRGIVRMRKRARLVHGEFLVYSEPYKAPK